jgi:hypothetical protein
MAACGFVQMYNDGGSSAGRATLAGQVRAANSRIRGAVVCIDEYEGMGLQLFGSWRRWLRGVIRRAGHVQGQ